MKSTRWTAALAAGTILLLTGCAPILLTGCGGGSGAPIVSAPSDPSEISPAETPTDDGNTDRQATGRLRFPIDLCDHSAVCLERHDNIQASLRETGLNLNGLYDPAAEPSLRGLSQRVSLLDSFDDALHGPINRGYYLADPDILRGVFLDNLDQKRHRVHWGGLHIRFPSPGFQNTMK